MIMNCRTLIVVVIVTFVIQSVAYGKRKKTKASSGCYYNLCRKGGEKYSAKEMKKMLAEFNSVAKKTYPETIIEPEDGKQLLRATTLIKEENLCSTRRMTTFPTFDAIHNVSIVNVKGQYQQRLEFEVCKSVKASGNCLKIGIFDYKTSCKQLFNNIRLLTVDSKTNKLSFKLIRVPTTCVCVYTNKNSKTKYVQP